MPVIQLHVLPVGKDTTKLHKLDSGIPLECALAHHMKWHFFCFPE